MKSKLRTEKHLDKLFGVMQQAGLFTAHDSKYVEQTFDMIVIADQQIAKYKRMTKNKAKRERIDKAFQALRPSNVLSDSEACLLLYRQHCNELIVRAMRKQSLQAATKAEVLVMLANISLKAPMRHEAVVLYSMIFYALLPGKLDFKETFRKEETEQAAVLLKEMRHTLRVTSRR